MCLGIVDYIVPGMSETKQSVAVGGFGNELLHVAFLVDLSWGWTWAGPWAAVLGFGFGLRCADRAAPEVVAVLIACVKTSDTCGVRTHALSDWRLKPAP